MHGRPRTGDVGKERESPAAEEKVKAWGRWLVREGRAHGLRPPCAEERARATGLAGCCRGLGIDGRALYDAVGIHFGPRCLQRRVVSVMQAWKAGDYRAMARTPAPTGEQIARGWGMA
eukprot:7065284-Pyramimonas_sp.AAC.1